MKDKQKAYEEKQQISPLKARAKLHELKTAGDEAWKDLKTGEGKAWDKVKAAHPHRSLKVQMGRTSGPAANRHARILAEAIILQSIEDLWHPVSKKGSLLFFEGDGFVLCSEIAGISYIRQLAMLRMLADARPKTSLRNIRKSPSIKAKVYYDRQ